MKMNAMRLLISSCCLLLISCRDTPSAWQSSLLDMTGDVPFIKGEYSYLNSPFVAAGDRVYLVGHQNGQFPDLGWHIKGEMGGIWDHPIKLMDGFTASLLFEQEEYCLVEADSFLNFPFVNAHFFSVPEKQLAITRLNFVPDGLEGLAIEFTIQNLGRKKISSHFRLNTYSDLRPTWLGDRTGMIDGEDLPTWKKTQKLWTVKDSLNDWHLIWGANQEPIDHFNNQITCQYQPTGKGIQTGMDFEIQMDAGGKAVLQFYIAGSYKSLEEAQRTYESVKNSAPDLLADKKEHYRELAGRSKLEIPDKSLQTTFQWLKYNTEWLVRDVPEIGRGISAGIPDYPWWFGVDSEYALQGAIAVGRKDLVYSTIELLVQLSEKTNGNGRIIHEASTNGAVYNPGNINETPQFASLIWFVYQWTGDRDFLQKYYPYVIKGLDWLMRENDQDGNLLPDGFGMMEIHGMDSEMVDVACYTQRAFSDAEKMAQVLKDTLNEKKYAILAARLKEKINQDFWVSEFKSFADFIGTTQQALSLIDDALVRADTLNKPWAVQELQQTREKLEKYAPNKKQGFVVHHNWVVNTPMETGIADAEKALEALETGSKFVNPFGVFVTGIDRDESAEQDEGSFAKQMKVFTYTGAVMTLPTGVQAIAENNYGRPDKALGYLKRMTKSFSYALPGSMYEVSPDFGMMAQAWNIYAFAVPIVSQFFGVKPDAAIKQVTIQPQMPLDWPKASLTNISVGDNNLDMHYSRHPKGISWQINQSRDGWVLKLKIPAKDFQTWELNGKKVQPEIIGGYAEIPITLGENNIQLHY